ncbi:MAG: response regulator transcription factor [Synechococcaceae cyanobacterium]|nr:response regulator transcription factor [Synechococcaceae cyanobacterium]
MDFTPLLPQLRQNARLANALLGDARVLLCLGSHALILLSVAALPRPTRIVAAASTEQEGLMLAERHQPDLLVVSDRLEQGCGIALAAAVRQRLKPCRILLLVSQEHRLWKIREAIEAGCDGILMESEIGLGHELTALRNVCSGRVYRQRRLDGGGGGPRWRPGGGDLRISAREREVLRLLVQGESRSNEAIARSLILSKETVRTHMRNLLTKLEARDRVHAALRAVHLGLVDYCDSPDDR